MFVGEAAASRDKGFAGERLMGDRIDLMAAREAR